MTAGDAVELCGLVRPRTAIPIHYEGWGHFQQSREEIENEFARAPEETRSSVRWLPVARRSTSCGSPLDGHSQSRDGCLLFMHERDPVHPPR